MSLIETLTALPAQKPILIAGPTASGKSALALAIARKQGRIIVNADASQIYNCWRVLTARPSREDEAQARHFLYGHTQFDTPYSAGHWLREVAPFLDQGSIIIGGTGLYFSALTEGLAEIPAIPPQLRARADQIALPDLIEALDPRSKARLDLANRARVQRAWEVQTHTGRALIDWQADTAPALLSEGAYLGIVLESPKEWLTPRIETRFEHMFDGGALEEVRAMEAYFDPKLPAFKIIGLGEIRAYLAGELSKSEAVERASIATRQYAKRQRSWFRARMPDWNRLDAPSLSVFLDTYETARADTGLTKSGPIGTGPIPRI